MKKIPKSGKIQLTPEKKEQIMTQVKADIDEAKQHYESNIEPYLQERLNIFDADTGFYDTMFPELSKRSKLVSNDASSVILWIMPIIDETFTGKSEYLSVKGVQGEDVVNAEDVQELVDMQIQRQNHGFYNSHSWTKDAVMSNWAWVKCWWEKKTETRKEKGEAVLNLAIQEDALMYSMLTSREDVKIISDETPSMDIHRIVYEVSTEVIVKNQPVLEPVPAYEVLVCPQATFSDYLKDTMPYIVHRKEVMGHYLKEKIDDGTFEKEATEKALKTSSSDEETQLEQTYEDETVGLGLTSETSKARRRYMLYEYYGKVDIDDDGLLEDIVVHTVNDYVLSCQYNTLGRHPMFLNTCMIEPHRLFAKKGTVDYVGQIQHYMTAFLRQLMINVALQNDHRTIYNASKIPPDAMEGLDQLIGVDGPLTDGDIYHEEIPAAINETLAVISLLDKKSGEWTGANDFAKNSVDSNSDRSATEASLLASGSARVIKEICHTQAEIGFKPLYRYIIELNKRFMDPQTAQRLLNKPLDLSQLSTVYDVEVNAGLGMTTKEMTVKVYQLLLNVADQTLGKYGLANIQTMRTIAARLAESMGIRDVDAVIPTTKESQLWQQFIAWKKQQEMQAALAQKVQQKLAQEAMQGGVGGGPENTRPVGSGGYAAGGEG